MEREITAPVDLCRPDGRLNAEAVGWTPWLKNAAPWIDATMPISDEKNSPIIR